MQNYISKARKTISWLKKSEGIAISDKILIFFVKLVYIIILIHSFKGEHFGIALIEAMSAGLIPISHNSGAAKEDNIVEEKFRYNDIDSALNCLDIAV